jgi:hypothetical protein
MIGLSTVLALNQERAKETPNLECGNLSPLWYATPQFIGTNLVVATSRDI